MTDMATKECEKIIDLAVEQGNASGPVEQHARRCAECAAVLACLGWLKTTGSPTSNLTPSAGYMNNLEEKISAATSKTIFSQTTAIALVIGTALTLAVAIGYFRPDQQSNAARPIAASQTPASTNVNNDPADSSANFDKMKQKFSAPVLQFPSPSDDIE